MQAIVLSKCLFHSQHVLSYTAFNDKLTKYAMSVVSSAGCRSSSNDSTTHFR